MPHATATHTHKSEKLCVCVCPKFFEKYIEKKKKKENILRRKR